MLMRFILFLSIATLGTNLFGQAPGQPKGGQPQAKQEDEPPPAMAVPPSYKFQTRGRRDPFVNPVPKPVDKKEEQKPPIVRPPGLKGVMLSEANVTAIVVSRQAPEFTRTMISAPGGKSYFAHKGDALYDATIKDIQRDAVVFVLSSKDREGRITTQEVVRKLRPTP